MQTLLKRYKRLLNNVSLDFVREIMNEIDWDERLIAIRGARGVGKTTLMLQYLKMHYNEYGDKAIYVSLDSAYFTQKTIYDFVEEFYIGGGKLIMFDEVHKYEHWSRAMKNIYDEYPNMKIVFSGSSLIQILNAEADLSRRCVAYDMQGLSFREYLKLYKDIDCEKYKLEELLVNPDKLCSEVNEKCRPLEFFREYLAIGYYPFARSGEEYYTKLESVVDMIVNVELPYYCNVDFANIRKLKALLVILANEIPQQIDTTKTAGLVGVSRLTLLNYLNHLHRANLITLLYSDVDSLRKMQKPDKIYPENCNLIYALATKEPSVGTIRETFFVNQLKYQHLVEYSKKGDFTIDKKYIVEVGGASKDGKQIAQMENAYIAADNIEYAFGNKIPLWCFGFLY